MLNGLVGGQLGLVGWFCQASCDLVAKSVDRCQVISPHLKQQDVSIVSFCFILFHGWFRLILQQKKCRMKTFRALDSYISLMWYMGTSGNQMHQPTSKEQQRGAKACAKKSESVLTANEAWLLNKSSCGNSLAPNFESESTKHKTFEGFLSAEGTEVHVQNNKNREATPVLHARTLSFSHAALEHVLRCGGCRSRHRPRFVPSA